MPINLIPLSFKIFPLKHKMFCKVKTFNLLYFSTAKYIFCNHQNNSYLKQVSKKRIPLSYKILPLSYKMFWKCDIIDILLVHSIKILLEIQMCIHVKLLDFQGGERIFPLHYSRGGF